MPTVCARTRVAAAFTAAAALAVTGLAPAATTKRYTGKVRNAGPVTFALSGASVKRFQASMNMSCVSAASGADRWRSTSSRRPDRPRSPGREVQLHRQPAQAAGARTAPARSSRPCTRSRPRSRAPSPAVRQRHRQGRLQPLLAERHDVRDRRVHEREDPGEVERLPQVAAPVSVTGSHKAPFFEH